MKKELYFLLTTILALSNGCYQKQNSEVFTPEGVDSLFKSEKMCVEDTKVITFYNCGVFTPEGVDSLFKSEKICVEDTEVIIFYKDTTENSDAISKVIFGKDTVAYASITGSIRTQQLIMFNDAILKECKIEYGLFNIDSMNLVFDLHLLDMCYLKSDPNIIVIRTMPMNWVGRMTQFSFFQIINTREKTMIEFIKKR